MVSSQPKVISSTRPQGFTLLEVLVALAIFGICAGTLLKHVGQSANNQQQIEMRVTASWVAEYHLESIRLANVKRDGNAASEYDLTRQYQAGNYAWIANARIEPTSNAGLDRVEIDVSLEQDNKNILAQLVGYLGIK